MHEPAEASKALGWIQCSDNMAGNPRQVETAMSFNLTRNELYDLVWAKPRRQIAKQLGISDVRLGKLCRGMNVPAPPRGYWANLTGRRRKRKYEKPPLTFNLAERIEA